MANYTIGNAPTQGDMANFRSILGSSNDVALVSKFAVRINSNGSLNFGDFGYDLMFLCDASEIPGRSLNVEDVRYYGPGFKLPYKTEYESLNLSFYCRSEMLEKEFFDLWMNAINPKNTYDFNYRNQYATQIDIFQFDVSGKSTYKVSLQNAYPISVNPIKVDWSQDNVMQLGVEFTYSDWVTPDDVAPESFKIVPGTIISGSYLINLPVR